VKYCLIRKVPFKTPGKKPRVVWGNILAESEGLVLVLVPKPEFSQPHSIFIAQENTADRVFEAMSPFCFNLTTEAVAEAANRLRIMGKSFEDADMMHFFRPKRHDEF
jgi:hypothetical protein